MNTQTLLLIIVSGLPGSGKSTLAQEISKTLKLPLFSVDPIESSIIKAGITKSFETGLAAYVVAQELASERLKLGFSVIIDAVSAVQEARDMWFDLQKQYKTELIIIECVLDQKLHKSRIESRVRNIYGIPEVTWSDVEKRSMDYLSWGDTQRLVIDSGQSIEINLARVLEYRMRK
jgi:predicted kinase